MQYAPSEQPDALGAATGIPSSLVLAGLIFEIVEFSASSSPPKAQEATGGDIGRARKASHGGFKKLVDVKTLSP